MGAYAYALMATKVIPATFPNLGLWAFWICLPIAGLLAAFWGVILGFPVLATTRRLSGDRHSRIRRDHPPRPHQLDRLLQRLRRHFARSRGHPSSVRRSTPADTGFAAVWGLEFSPVYRTIFLYYVIVCLALLTAWVSNRLRKLPVGRAWEALREDEIACRSLGINTVNTKLTAFAIGAMFGGFAGSFFAARQGFISPESFTFMESAVILAIVVLGGMGSLLGTAIAAVAMIGGTELLRELDWMKAIFGNDFDPVQYRMLIFGLAMVVIMIWKPRGFVSTRMHRPPSLKTRRAVSVRPRQGGPRMSDATHARVEHLTMRFGGLVAVNDLSFEAEARRHHRRHRSERSRQDDGLQLHHRLLQAEPGARSRCIRPAAAFSTSSGCPTSSIAPAGEGRAHLPEHPSVLGHDRAGEPFGRPAQSR